MTQEKILDLFEQIREGKRQACIYGAGAIGKNFGVGLLRERGVNPDFFCDTNSKLWGEEIVSGIRCISIDEFISRNPVCFVMVSNAYIQEIQDFVYSLGVKDVILFGELCEMKLGTYFKFKERKQIAVYTCIVGGYDELKEPIATSKECDYYLISDKMPTKETIYKYIDIADFELGENMDNTRKNRYCKLMPHKIFPDYRYSIYIDGSIQIKSKNIYNKVYELPATRIMAYANNFVDCIYMEAMRAAENLRDKKEIIISQAEKYWLEGMPEQFGSVLCTTLIREHNNPICVKLMNDWWNEVENYSRKDQISFPYVIWKNSFKMSDVGMLLSDMQNEFDNEYVIWFKEHKLQRV